MLPQRSHLLRPGAAEAGAGQLPLRLERARGSRSVTENIADGTNLFRLIDRENKIFARTAAKSVLQRTPARDAIPDMLPITTANAGCSDLVRRTESLLLDQYAPPGVIVNEAWRSSTSGDEPGPTSSLRPADRSTTF